MRVKYLFAALAALFLSGSFLFAQTPEEIVERMIAEMDRGSAEGFSMDFNMKIPIVGTVYSHNMVLGDKMKTQLTGKDKSSTSWSDATTKWTYDSRSGEITIENKTSSGSDNSDTKAFDNIADGYRLTLKKETADAWYIKCRKSKTNTNKDDPQNMELVVRKGTFHPISLSTKMSGVTLTMKDLRFGVSEAQVTFDIKQYPGVKIVDKR